MKMSGTARRRKYNQLRQRISTVLFKLNYTLNYSHAINRPPPRPPLGANYDIARNRSLTPRYYRRPQPHYELRKLRRVHSAQRSVRHRGVAVHKLNV